PLPSPSLFPYTTLFRSTASQIMIVVAFMFTTVLGLSAAVVSSPSVSGDLESGLALSMLARPVRRADLLLGKWLGFVVLVVAYSGDRKSTRLNSSHSQIS